MKNSHASRLTLKPRSFFGWTMYPGYSDRPYHSPIQVHSIRMLGQRKFDLSVLNILYAAGVQRMEISLRTIRREATYIVAEETMNGSLTDRIVIIEPLNERWIDENVPKLSAWADRLFDANGKPVEAAFYELTS